MPCKVIAGFAAGIAFGFAAGPFVSDYTVLSDFIMPVLDVSGKIFFRLLIMLLVPLVFSSVVSGASSLNGKRKLGSVFAKTLAMFVVTSSIAVVFGLALGNVIAPGEGISIPHGLHVAEKEALSLSDIVLSVFPSNLPEAMAKLNLLQVILFAVFFGAACFFAGEKGRRVADFFSAVAKVFHSLTLMIMKLTPYGVFALVAVTTARFGPAVLAPLSKLLAAVYFGCIVHAMVTYSGIIMMFCKRSPIWFFRGIREAAAVAFATRSSYAALPVAMANVRDNLGVSKAVSSIIMPLGASVNLDGTALYDGVCALFVAQMFSIPLTLPMQISVVVTTTLASIVTAGIPGHGHVILTMILSMIGLPAEGMAIVAGIDAVLDMVRTSLNITGDAAVCAAVAVSEGEILPQASNS